MNTLLNIPLYTCISEYTNHDIMTHKTICFFNLISHLLRRKSKIVNSFNKTLKYLAGILNLDNPYFDTITVCGLRLNHNRKSAANSCTDLLKTCKHANHRWKKWRIYLFLKRNVSVFAIYRSYDDKRLQSSINF